MLDASGLLDGVLNLLPECSRAAWKWVSLSAALFCVRGGGEGMVFRRRAWRWESLTLARGPCRPSPGPFQKALPRPRLFLDLLRALNISSRRWRRECCCFRGAHGTEICGKKGMKAKFMSQVLAWCQGCWEAPVGWAGVRFRPVPQLSPSLLLCGWAPGCCPDCSTCRIVWTWPMVPGRWSWGVESVCPRSLGRFTLGRLRKRVLARDLR